MKKEVNKTKNEKKVTAKKVTTKKVEKVKNNSEWNGMLKITLIVLVIFGFFFLLTWILIGDYGTEKEDETETAIQYEEIVAGASFKMNAKQYLVVYYDETSDEASEILNAIYTYKYSTEPLTVYTVDLSDAINKYVVSEKSNKSPKSAKDLAINGTTIIRFKDGSVKEYIEGNDKVINYLNKKDK